MVKNTYMVLNAVDGVVRYFHHDKSAGYGLWTSSDRADTFTNRRAAERIAKRYVGAWVESC